MENQEVVKKVAYKVTWYFSHRGISSPVINKYFETRQKADEFIDQLKQAATTLQLWDSFNLSRIEIEMD